LLRDGPAQCSNLGFDGRGGRQGDTLRRLIVRDWSARLVPIDSNDSKGRLGFIDYGPNPKLGVEAVQHHIRAIEKIALLAAMQRAILSGGSRPAAERDFESGLSKQTEIRDSERGIVIFDQEVRTIMRTIGLTP
jgi:hypothetical protein